MNRERIGNIGLAMFVICLAAMAFLIVASPLTFAMGPKYDYREAVGGHITIARGAPTPELIMSELNLAAQGMRELNLNEDMYSRFWSWKKTPDKQMVFQYALLENISLRCQEVIQWRERQDMMSGQIADVYAQKMDALRDEVKDCDAIAYGAFKVNIEPFYGVYVYIILYALFLLIIGSFLCMQVDMRDGDLWLLIMTLVAFAVIAPAAVILAS